ncbi:MAG: hypothetical protein HY010_16550 [Acidobacteria bacterium]|nr:hypothetical protein [Acidobacteriota bacterium]
MKIDESGDCGMSDSATERNMNSVCPDSYFNQLSFEQGALDLVRQFRNPKTLIIDVRNNSGGIAPQRLIELLMNRPHREWKESTTMRVGDLSQ